MAFGKPPVVKNVLMLTCQELFAPLLAPHHSQGLVPDGITEQLGCILTFNFVHCCIEKPRLYHLMNISCSAEMPQEMGADLFAVVLFWDMQLRQFVERSVLVQVVIQGKGSLGGYDESPPKGAERPQSWNVLDNQQNSCEPSSKDKCKSSSCFFAQLSGMIEIWLSHIWHRGRHDRAAVVCQRSRGHRVMAIHTRA